MIAVVASLLFAAAPAAAMTPVHDQEQIFSVDVIYMNEPQVRVPGEHWAETHVAAQTLRSKGGGGTWTEETIWEIRNRSYTIDDAGKGVLDADTFLVRSDEATSIIEPVTLTIKGRHSAHLVGTLEFERGTLHVDLTLTAIQFPPQPGHNEDSTWTSSSAKVIGDVTLNGSSLLFPDTFVDEANIWIMFRH